MLKLCKRKLDRQWASDDWFYWYALLYSFEPKLVILESSFINYKSNHNKINMCDILVLVLIIVFLRSTLNISEFYPESWRKPLFKNSLNILYLHFKEWKTSLSIWFYIYIYFVVDSILNISKSKILNKLFELKYEIENGKSKNHED